MAFLGFLSLAIFGFVAFIVCVIPLFVELEERRRMLRVSLRPRRLFRPRVIEGGKPEAAPVVVASTEEAPESRIA
jgi:hypothetical protein